MRRRLVFALLGATITVAAALPLQRVSAQDAAGRAGVGQAPAPVHGVRPRRLVIRNAMVIEGNGTPAGVEQYGDVQA